MNFGLRALLALLAAMAVTAVSSYFLIPVLRKKKMEQHVRDDGPSSHLSKEGTPTMGGIMILFGLLSGLLFFFYNDGRAVNAVLFLLMGTLLFGFIGFLDDFIKMVKKRSLGLRAWQKIVLQLGAAFVTAWFAFDVLNLRQELIPFAGTYWDLGNFYIPFTMLVFLAVTNAVNLTDGLDGLASSCVMINGVSFFAIIVLMFPALLLVRPEALIGKEGIIANTGIFSAALVGACLGFFFFNRHPAKVFMGDTGAFALGGALGAIATALDLQLLLPIVGFVYVLNALSVIIQVGSFKLRHKRVFKMAPLHHHFELMGIPETRVVGGYVIVTVVASVIGIVSAFF